MAKDAEKSKYLLEFQKLPLNCSQREFFTVVCGVIKSIETKLSLTYLEEEQEMKLMEKETFSTISMINTMYYIRFDDATMDNEYATCLVKLITLYIHVLTRCNSEKYPNLLPNLFYLLTIFEVPRDEHHIIQIIINFYEHRNINLRFILLQIARKYLLKEKLVPVRYDDYIFIKYMLAYRYYRKEEKQELHRKITKHFLGNVKPRRTIITNGCIAPFLPPSSYCKGTNQHAKMIVADFDEKNLSKIIDSNTFSCDDYKRNETVYMELDESDHFIAGQEEDICINNLTYEGDCDILEKLPIIQHMRNYAFDPYSKDRDENGHEDEINAALFDFNQRMQQSQLINTGS